MQKWFEVPRRATQYWLNGTRPVPPGIAAELRVITDAARAHVDELAAKSPPRMIPLCGCVPLRIRWNVTGRSTCSCRW